MKRNLRLADRQPMTPRIMGARALFVVADSDEKTFSYQAPDEIQFFGHVDVARQRGDIEFARLNDEAQERLAIFRAAQFLPGEEQIK